MRIEREVGRIARALRAAGSTERAAGAKAYLKSELDFYGVRAAELRQQARRWSDGAAPLDRDDLLTLARALWSRRNHDLRSFGVALLELHPELLRLSELRLVEDLVRRSGTWAHADWLSTKVAGDLVRRFPRAKRTLARWAIDGDFWVRRAALLSLLDDLRRGSGDWDLFVALASPLLEEREFFIRKAIGWVLREVSKKRPALVTAFLADHLDRVSALTLREGTRYLPAVDRDRLRAGLRKKR